MSFPSHLVIIVRKNLFLITHLIKQKWNTDTSKQPLLCAISIYHVFASFYCCVLIYFIPLYVLADSFWLIYVCRILDLLQINSGQVRLIVWVFTGKAINSSSACSLCFFLIIAVFFMICCQTMSKSESIRQTWFSAVSVAQLSAVIC